MQFFIQVQQVKQNNKHFKKDLYCADLLSFSFPSLVANTRKRKPTDKDCADKLTKKVFQKF